MPNSVEHKSYEISEADKERDANNFKYHPPTPGQIEKYPIVRNKGHEFAILLRTLCPQSRELSLAITRVEEAVMWANAAIARNEKPDESA